LSATRPVSRPIVPVGSTPPNALPEGPPPAGITYKGYRSEPSSYWVTSTAWSPRVVVSLRTDKGAWQRTPIYSTNPAKVATRDEAARCALDVARGRGSTRRLSGSG